VVKEGLNNFFLLSEHLATRLGVFPLSIWELGELPISIFSEIIKFKPVFVHNKGEEVIEGLYQTPFEGHIYIRKVSVHFCEIKILYTPEQLDEVKFFINRLYKLNDTRN
jgi:hypothetical protein